MDEVTEPLARPRRRAPWLLWLGSWLLLFCTAHGNIESTDSAITMQGARALLLRGDSGLLRSADGAEWLAEGLLADHIVQQAPNGFGKTGKDGRHQYVWFPVGHLLLMVPAVAVGELLARLFPGVEDAYRARSAIWYHEGQFVFDQAVVAMTMPATVGATTILLLFLIARLLGCRDREAAFVALATMFGTQCLATARETISNGAGMVFLLGAILAMLRSHLGVATRWTMVAGGLCAGAAVTCRYQQAVLLVPIGVVLALAAVRQRRLDHVLAFALAGVPCAVLLLGVNQARFGDPFTTGYPPIMQWSFNYPTLIGLARMTTAASKGILWLSPLLWLVVPIARRRALPCLWWFPWVVLVVPVLMFASLMGGWQSGQCWGSRYVTDGIVVFTAWVLAQVRPWRTWRKTFAVLLAAGIAVNVTGIVAPVRGHAAMAAQGLFAYYEAERAAGRVDDRDLAGVAADPPDRFYQLWRFSVLHVNWTYAWLSATGRFEDDAGQLRNGAANTIEPLFGVTSQDPARGVVPTHWEDRNFRHLWWKFWGDLLGVPWWALLLPAAAAAGAVLRAAWRQLSRD